MVVKWKGRSKFKMYNPSKPEKYHKKTFGLCDSHTGYAYNLLILEKRLLIRKMYQEGNQKKYSNIYYSHLALSTMFPPIGTIQFNLISYLSAKRFYYTGTLMSNHKNFPTEKKNPKIKHTESKFYCS